MEQEKLTIKYGISRKGANELVSEAELLKIPEVKVVVPEPVPVVEKQIKKVIKKDEKPIKKLGAKLGDKKPVKRSNLKGHLAKKR